MSRTFAIGDIHGCLGALQQLDDHLVFGPEDTVITIGDYIDRGPDSKGVIEHLMALRQRTRLITLRGNHEVMMLESRNQGLDYLEAWLGAGGVETMESYGADGLNEIPAAHWQFFDTTQAIFTTPTHVFVHANLIANLPLNEQSDEVVYWMRIEEDQPPHCSGKIMICGHTPQRSGLPLNLGHAVCIDTWVYSLGWLTCLEVNSGRYWQANQRTGELREATLIPPP